MAAAKFEEGKTLFGEEKFSESKAALSEALAAAEAAGDASLVKQITLWIRKCNTHLPQQVGEAKPPSNANTVTPSQAPPVAQAGPQPAPAAPNSAPPTVHTPFVGNVRFEWFQTPTNISFTFYVKNRISDDIRITAQDRALDIIIALDASCNKEYQYSLEHLFAPILTSPSVNIRPMKVEVTFQKVTPFHWPTLEVRDGDVVKTIENPQAVAAATAPPTAKELSYPNSKGKDWTKFKVAEEEETEKPSGDAALNALFKQIYGNCTEDQRKAMIKSFTESNGTVLSTNWEDVKEKKVVGEPPKGMEAVKYEA